MQMTAVRDGAADGPVLRPLTDAFDLEDRPLLEAISRDLEGRTERQKNPHPPGSLAFGTWVCARLGGWTGYSPMTRPNVLVLMVDQLAGTFFPDGPAALPARPEPARARRPLRPLRQRLLPPARSAPPRAPPSCPASCPAAPASTTTPPSSPPTSRPSPTTCAAPATRPASAGKMHFVGPDQLHGFEERLTTDIYPADFGWTPDYTRPGERIDWWYHNLGSVTGAGTAEITNQLEYDDEVAYHATAKLHDLSRRHDPRPWCLTVSFTHPHDPYVARPRFWDLYADCPALDPETGPIPFDDAGPARPAPDARLRLRRLRRSPPRTSAAPAAPTSPTSATSTRRSARSSPSSTRAGMAEDTAILFLSDHGDMLGERGLWFKMSFRDASARVPLMLAAPGLAPGRRDAPVSTLDVLPTLADLAGARPRSTATARASSRAAPPRPGPDGIRRRRQRRPDGRPPRRPLQAHPLRRRPAAPLRPRGRPARGARTSPPTPPTPPPSPASPPPSAPAGTSPASTARSARARPAAASSTRRCATAPTSPGTTSRCSAPPSATCATTWT